MSLTKGLSALVDDADYPLVSDLRWRAVQGKNGTWYAYAQVRLADGKRRDLPMHRLLNGLGYGDLQTVDHIDHDGLNNCRNNLRVSTHQENVQYRRKCRNQTASKFKGVYWRKDRGHWFAKIMCDGRSTYLGQFLTEEAAARAYDSAARKHFGAFAHTNY